MKLSVIIPTHNPSSQLFQRCLGSIMRQCFDAKLWELIIVDNASNPAITTQAIPEQIKNKLLVQEPALGLTKARIKGFKQAQGEFFVLVDDDNLLAENYLTSAALFLDQHPAVAAVGGKIIPEFEKQPDNWTKEFLDNLALRDFGDKEIIDEPTFDQHNRLLYPKTAPVGAGMIVRKQAAMSYVNRIESEIHAEVTDRQGSNLSSSGDNDIVLGILKANQSIAYCPQLKLTHFIPAQRVSFKYLCKIRYSIGRSWVKVLDKHQSNPWPSYPSWQWPLRSLKSFVRESAYSSKINFVRWCSNFGILKGRAELHSQKQGPKSIVQQLRLGSLAYYLYHEPLGKLKSIHKTGLVTWIRVRQGKKQMEKSVHQLKVPSSRKPDLDVYYLTGKKFWQQTCFCHASLQRNAPFQIRPIIIDDGSCNSSIINAIKKVLPQSEIITNQEIEQRLEKHLPIKHFPSLRSRRLEYPQLKKLTDIHLASKDWKLVLDSDMLFFDEPKELLQWLQNPQQACHMTDTQNAYGYSEKLMSDLAEATIEPKINVGVTGLKSETIDWQELEHWSQQMIKQEGKHYFQEQALVAMLISREDAFRLPQDTYICQPTLAQVKSGTGVLHHYVADSKNAYFRYAWRKLTEKR